MFAKFTMFINVLLLVLLVLGWFCIYVVGHLILGKYIKCFPVLLASPKPEKIENLMRF